MTKRQSNLEILRIAAMVMIVAYHIFYYVVNMQLTGEGSAAGFQNYAFCYPGFSVRLCLLALISPMGQLSNAIFVLISGYFMANKPHIDLTKSIGKLLAQLAVAAALLGLLSLCACAVLGQYPAQPVDFRSFNSLSWFAGYYVIIMILARLFLNDWLQKMDRKQHVMFMAALFALVELGWSRDILRDLAAGLDVVCLGAFFYCLGGYIGKYNPLRTVRLWVIVAVIAVMNLTVLANFYIATMGAVASHSGGIFVQRIPLYYNHEIVPVVLAVAVFELFRRIRMPRLRIVNFLGAATFMVYLLHDNTLFHGLWQRTDWLGLLEKSVPGFIAAYGAQIFMAFAAGVAAYCLLLLGRWALRRCRPLLFKDGEQN